MALTPAQKRSVSKTLIKHGAARANGGATATRNAPKAHKKKK